MRQVIDKNQLSYPKALNFINSYNLTRSGDYNSNSISSGSSSRVGINRAETPNRSTPLTNSTPPTNNTRAVINPYSKDTPSNKSMKDYINKSIQGLNSYRTNDNYNSNERESKYNSNLTSQKDKKLELNMANPIERKGIQSKNDQDNKQINIKIINNHINHYIISPDNQENVKKQKAINTFRNSYNVPQSHPQNNESLNKSNNQGNKITPNAENLKNSSIVNNGNNNYGKFNLKNLNLNIGGVEVKSPVLKNNPQGVKGVNNSSNKYSSLIDNQNLVQNGSRPSSAIILKGRHNREGSTHSLKNDQINLNMNPYHSPLARSPSSQSIVHHLNRNYSQQKLKKETPRHNYLSNIDPPKNINLSQGYKTVRPSSGEKLRINYAGTNSLVANQIKTPSRYEVDDSLNKRGYSLSSRASDMRQQPYRYNEINGRYSNNTPSKIYSVLITFN